MLAASKSAKRKRLERRAVNSALRIKSLDLQNQNISVEGNLADFTYSVHTPNIGG